LRTGARRLGGGFAEIVRDHQLVHDDAEDILKRLLRLVQVASNPRLVDESYRGQPGKLQAVRELVARAIGEQSKIILWTNFIENARWLASQFSAEGAVAVHGQRAIAERNATIAAFKTDPDCKVLVATPGAAKEGLTLTIATHAVFFDRSFSLDDYLQSQDRIHRISQTRTCFIWNLIATDTVDEWVDMLLAAKHLAAQLAQGDIEHEEYRKRANYEFGHVIRGILGLSDETE
jgi:SNF2 family DNA or RNA helicase